jgi:hypothetical protein
MKSGDTKSDKSNAIVIMEWQAKVGAQAGPTCMPSPPVNTIALDVSCTGDKSGEAGPPWDGTILKVPGTLRHPTFCQCQLVRGLRTSLTHASGRESAEIYIRPSRSLHTIQPSQWLLDKNKNIQAHNQATTDKVQLFPQPPQALPMWSIYSFEWLCTTTKQFHHRSGSWMWSEEKINAKRAYHQ